MSLFKRGSKQAKIVPNQTFLDGANRYEKGKTYTVELGLARYFQRNGWVEGSHSGYADSPAALDVDDSALGHNGGF